MELDYMAVRHGKGVGSIEKAVYACKLLRRVILSEAKNLWSLLDRVATTKIRDVSLRST